MKNALIDQISNYDCGTTTVINALRYLYERSEILPELVVAVYNKTLDEYSPEGGYGQRGTSFKALRHIAAYFNAYGKGTGFPIRATVYSGADASITEGSPVVRELANGAVAAARVWHGKSGHYILLVGIENDRVFAYDPYVDDTVIDGEQIRKYDDPAHRINRSVAFDVFDPSDKHDYALKSKENADPTDPEGGEIVVIARTEEVMA